MANSMYGLGREAFLEGTIAALSDTLAISLVSNSYTPNLATDQFYSTVTGSGGVVAGPVSLTSVTGAAGTLSAANVTFSSVSGSTVTQIVLFKNTGTGSTSPLIGNINVATGLPVTPNGGNITVAWSSGQVFTLFEGLKDSEKNPEVVRRLKELIRRLKNWKLSPGGVFIPEPTVSLA